MKKIGILTLQYGLNYGGVLQCYALKEVLRNLGYDAVIIDRIPDGFGFPYVLKRAFVHPFTQKEYAGFRRNKLKPISKPIHSSEGLKALLKGFDACIVGSDQVWRKAVFSVNGDYFLQHIDLPKLNKLSYAASMGVSEWEYTPEETRVITSALSRFKAISVREKDAVELLREHCGLSSEFVLDPTLLATTQIYDPLLKKSKKDGNGSIVTYILDWTGNKKSIVEGIEKMMGKTSIDINPSVKKRQNLLQRITHKGVTVYDWVRLIATADYVITDSFHGTVFSIIFNKQFTTIGNPERGMVRFTSLLGLFGLNNRLVTDIPKQQIEIDYTHTNDVLNQMREESNSFLVMNLG